MVHSADYGKRAAERAKERGLMKTNQSDNSIAARFS